MGIYYVEYDLYLVEGHCVLLAATAGGFGPFVCAGVIFTVHILSEGQALGVDSAAAPTAGHAAGNLIVLALPIILKQIRYLKILWTIRQSIISGTLALH